MNYWVTPKGQVFEGENIGFHSYFCYDFIKNDEVLEKEYREWDLSHSREYIPAFFEDVKKWVRYCDWMGVIQGWVIRSTTKLTKKQKERIFELTGDWFE